MKPAMLIELATFLHIYAVKLIFSYVHLIGKGVKVEMADVILQMLDT